MDCHSSPRKSKGSSQCCSSETRNGLPTSQHLPSSSTQLHQMRRGKGRSKLCPEKLVTFTNSMWSFPVNVETSPWTLSFPFLMLMGMISSCAVLCPTLSKMSKSFTTTWPFKRTSNTFRVEEMTESQSRFRHVTAERGTQQERSLLFMHAGPESIVTCPDSLFWEGFRAQKQPGKDTKALPMLSNTLKSAFSFQNSPYICCSDLRTAKFYSGLFMLPFHNFSPA